MNRETVLTRPASMIAYLSLRLNQGVDFKELIEGATVRPAAAIGREDLGRLQEGGPANIALFTIERGSFRPCRRA